MAKAVLITGTVLTDPDREAEFNEWYDKIHIPDVLETPGFVKATRYTLAVPGQSGSRQAEYVTLYELDRGDLEQAEQDLQETHRRNRERGRFVDCFEVVHRGYYTSVSED